MKTPVTGQETHKVGEYGLTRALTTHLAAKKKKKRQQQIPTDSLAHCHSLDKLTLLHHQKNLQIRRHINEKAQLAAANEQLRALHENPTLREQSLRSEIHELQVQLQQVRRQLEQQQKMHEEEMGRVRDSHQREITAVRQQMQRERSSERERGQQHAASRGQYVQEGERREGERHYGVQFKQIDRQVEQVDRPITYVNSNGSFSHSPSKNQPQHQQYSSRVVEPSKIERVSPKKESHYTTIVNAERTPPSPRVYTINKEPSPTLSKPTTTTYTPGTPLYLSPQPPSDRLTPTVIPHPLKTSSPDNTRSTNTLNRLDPSPLSTFNDFKRDLLSSSSSAQPRRVVGSAKLVQTDMQQIYRRYCIND